MFSRQGVGKDTRPVPALPKDYHTAVAELETNDLLRVRRRRRLAQSDCLCCVYGWVVQGCFRTYPERVSFGAVFRVSGPRDGWIFEKRWILGGFHQDAWTFLAFQRLHRWSTTSPSFVIVLITPENSSPGFLANRSHSLDSG